MSEKKELLYVLISTSVCTNGIPSASHFASESCARSSSTGGVEHVKGTAVQGSNENLGLQYSVHEKFEFVNCGYQCGLTMHGVLIIYVYIY